MGYENLDPVVRLVGYDLDDETTIVRGIGVVGRIDVCDQNLILVKLSLFI